MMLYWRLILGLLLITSVGCASMRHSEQSQDTATSDIEPDPLASFNRPMFTFNQKLDSWVLKPAASGWSVVVPQAGRVSIARFFNNTEFIPRFANALFQFRLVDAGTELARFGINTTVGLAGFFDPADRWLGLKQHNNDFGLTLSKLGVGEGAYVVLPLFGPSTVRDAIGKVADGAMDPLRYLAPSTVVVYAAEAGARATEWVNYRSLNANLFSDLDRFAIDQYGAVQDGYIERRRTQENGVGSYWGKSPSDSNGAR